MYLNHPDLVHKHPVHLASSVKIKLEKVRHSRTNPKRMWKNSTHLAISAMMRFEEVRCA